MCGNVTSKNRASASGVTSTPSQYYARTNLSWTLRQGFRGLEKFR